MSIKKTVKELREGAGLTQAQLSELTGIPQSRIAKWEVRGSTPKIDDYEKVVNAVISSTNVPDESSSSEDEPYYRKRQRLKNEGQTNKLLYYDVNAEAGTVAPPEILPVRKSDGVLHIGDLFRGSQYAIRVSGNSMIPSYPPGAIIGIREIGDKQITPGSVYVVQKEDALWIKRLFYKNDDQTTGVFECVSDNAIHFESGARKGRLCYPAFYLNIDDVSKLFKVTGIYKPNDLMVIE